MSNDCNNNKHIDGYDCDSTKTYSIFMVMKFVKTLMVKLFPINNNDHNMGKLLNTNSSIRFDELFNFNPMASQLITSYQKKICHYDKQQWDRTSAAITMAMTTEDQMTVGVKSNKSSLHSQKATPSQWSSSNQSNSTTTTPNNIINADLIDLDLISGSAYTMKSKSQQGWISMLFQAILRVAFFPLYLRWWAEQTSAFLVTLLFILYIMQIISIRLYYQKNITTTFNNASFNSSTATNSSSTSNSTKSNEFSEISATEVLMPIAMMIVLGIIHTQIVGIKNFKLSSTSSSSSYGTSSSNTINNHSNLSSTNNAHKTHHHHHHHNHHSSSHQTDCSSTSGSSSSSSSSTSSSVDSSPVANVHQRIQNRMARLEKFQNNNNHHSSNSLPTNYQKSLLPKTSPINLPKIRFSNENGNQTINRSLDVDDDDDNMVNDFPVIPPRKRADSLPRSWSKNKPSRLRTSKKPTKPSFTSSWSYEDDHLNSSPVSLRSSLYGSSIDSEGTISPMTPTVLQGEEWPTIQSDASSFLDEEENNAQYDYYPDHSRVRNSQYKSQSTVVDEDYENHDPTPSNQSNQSDKTSKIHIAENGPTNTQPPSSTTATSVQTVSNELKVSCSLWQHNVCQKFDLSVVDISSSIIRKVETVEHSNEYIYLGILFSLTVSLIPSFYRLQYSTKDGPSIAQILNSSSLAVSIAQPVVAAAADVSHLSDLYGLLNFFLDEAFYFNRSARVRFVILTAMIERFVLSLIFFFLLCVTERTFKQRFLYSKYFSHITRRDRAKRSQIPHFRLHKVRNLKVWLSVRSYLRRYGPHRSVDTICSTTFIISICLLTCISLQILKDSNESCTTRLICWEMIFWSLAMGIYIMRLMILGSRINQKYRSNLSVLITEQINLYLQLERKPHKKDALMLANQVLKLAVDLLKELESPYKISGFSANPYLYNITKVVVLSAFSAVLTEMLGFKLKLYKIKLMR
ncbi:putative homeodomain transcription factor [Dermatophagoides pteronyssinus]|uniref:putative homeodomain transcription factor n=1 Tax=Dermatophagoides pteronyssinus TaxID=6956 RepID=UPI003F6616C3